jgi:hypothetical protein
MPTAIIYCAENILSGKKYVGIITNIHKKKIK